MNKQANFVEYLRMLSKEDSKREIDVKIADTCDELEYTEEVTSEMTMTNATGFFVDHYEITEIDLGSDEARVSVNFRLSGEQYPEKTWCGTEINEQATGVIDADGEVSYKDIAAERDLGYDEEEHQDRKLREIWQQAKIPVVYRPTGSKPLLIRLPYAQDNRSWLKEGHRNRPRWDTARKHWEAPRAWLEDIVRRALTRYGKIYVIQPFRTQEKCASACWNAKGIDCECSCRGARHGSGNPSGKWYVISETCAVRWSDRQYSCRLIAVVGEPGAVDRWNRMPK